MAPRSLGKRTRDARETETDSSLPAKRTRYSLRAAAASSKQKNEDQPAEVPGIKNTEEDQENLKLGSEPQSRNEEPAPEHPSKEVLKNAAYRAPVTPSTPRHYDAFAKSVSTPRHLVLPAGKLSRRLTPQTQTPTTPVFCQTVYHKARQLFSRSADGGQLIGRDEERSQITRFLSRLNTHPSGCLYVSGPPGTGKSATVNDVVGEVAGQIDNLRRAYVNCMEIKSSKDLYVSLVDQLYDEDEKEAMMVDENDAMAVLESMFVPKRKKNATFNSGTESPCLVVLDEVDHLLTMDIESLYRVFQWSLRKASALALVGIANALDLTDRFLPRLKSRNLKPELLPFLPYTAPQVKNIITTRLKSLLPESTTAKPDFVPFFHPAAIELCARKVSTQTGDLRRAFEVCRRALDLVENETRLQREAEIKQDLVPMTPSTRRVLGENKNLASTRMAGLNRSVSVSANIIKALQALTVETAPRVSIAHLNKVTAAAFSNGAGQRLKTLNLQQKAALCALSAMEKRNRLAQQRQAALAASMGSRRADTATLSPSLSSRSSSPYSRVVAPTVRQLFDAYCRLCKRDSLLHPLSSSEFREVVGSLETLSLVAPVDGRTGTVAGSSPSVGGSGGMQVTPRRGGGRKKDVFGNVGANGDDKRVASCVGEREIEQAIEGLGADILRSIMSGEALG